MKPIYRDLEELSSAINYQTVVDDSAQSFNTAFKIFEGIAQLTTSKEEFHPIWKNFKEKFTESFLKPLKKVEVDGTRYNEALSILCTKERQIELEGLKSRLKNALNHLKDYIDVEKKFEELSNFEADSLQSFIESVSQEFQDSIFKKYYLLHTAVLYNNTILINTLVTEGFHVDSLNKELMTPLQVAVEKYQLNAVKTLLDQLADVNKNFNNLPPLAIACSYVVKDKALTFDQEEIINVLLEENVNLNWATPHKHTILHMACRLGYHNILPKLLKKELDINAQDLHGNTPLHEIAKTGSLELITILFKEQKANLYNANKFDHTPFDLAFLHVEEKDHIKLLETIQFYPIEGSQDSDTLYRVFSTNLKDLSENKQAKHGKLIKNLVIYIYNLEPKVSVSTEIEKVAEQRYKNFFCLLSNSYKEGPSLLELIIINNYYELFVFIFDMKLIPLSHENVASIPVRIDIPSSYTEQIATSSLMLFPDETQHIKNELAKIHGILYKVWATSNKPMMEYLWAKFINDPKQYDTVSNAVLKYACEKADVIAFRTLVSQGAPLDNILLQIPQIFCFSRHSDIIEEILSRHSDIIEEILFQACFRNDSKILNEWMKVTEICLDYRYTPAEKYVLYKALANSARLELYLPAILDKTSFMAKGFFLGCTFSFNNYLNDDLLREKLKVYMPNVGDGLDITAQNTRDYIDALEWALEGGISHFKPEEHSTISKAFFENLCSVSWPLSIYKLLNSLLIRLDYCDEDNNNWLHYACAMKHPGFLEDIFSVSSHSGRTALYFIYIKDLSQKNTEGKVPFEILVSKMTLKELTEKIYYLVTDTETIAPSIPEDIVFRTIVRKFFFALKKRRDFNFLSYIATHARQDLLENAYSLSEEPLNIFFIPEDQEVLNILCERFFIKSIQKLVKKGGDLSKPTESGAIPWHTLCEQIFRCNIKQDIILQELCRKKFFSECIKNYDLPKEYSWLNPVDCQKNTILQSCI